MFIKQNFAQFWFLCRDQTYCAFGLRLCLGILAFPFFFVLYFLFLCTRFKKYYVLFSGSRALFTGPTSTLFRKKNKNESHGIIHAFKNYFVTVFSIFSKISDIQTNL